MSIIDQTTTDTTANLYAPGRTVWVSSAGRRAAVVSASNTPGQVHTLAGLCTDPIPLPSPGDALAGGGYFIGWASADETDLTGLVSDALTVKPELRMSPAQWDARYCLRQHTEPLDAATILSMLTRQVAKSATDLTERVETARREGRQEAEQAAREHLDRLVSAAHEWANQHDMCERFDEFCRDWDLPEREHEWDANVTLTVRVPVRLRTTGSCNSDNAYEAFREQHDADSVWRMIRDHDIDSDNVDPWDVTVDDVELMD